MATIGSDAGTVLLPDLGEDIDEADVLQIYVSVGDLVAIEQPLLEIETEKATLDLPSPLSGTVTAIHVRSGDTIRPGDAVLHVEASTASVASTPAIPSAAPQPPAAPSQTAPRREAEPTMSPTIETPVTGPPNAFTVPLGASESPALPAPPPLVEGDPESQPVFASPSARRFAREIGVEIRAVRGSGPGGRIDLDDIKRHARERPSQTPLDGQAGLAPGPLPDFSEFGAIERVAMSRLRRTIKRNMSVSWREVPHVTLHHTADVTELEQVRRDYRDRAEEAGGRLTITAILLKITAAALQAHPHANSSIDTETDELILKRYVHIGVAVDTPRGLVVPVIRDVDQKNIIQLSVELTDISERARSGGLGLQDFRGSSFTLTNLGGLGTGHFTPIIHHPNTAILGIGRAERRPIWSEPLSDWEARSILPLSFTFDHRAMDGADGARFMTWIADVIRQPLVLALGG